VQGVQTVPDQGKATVRVAQDFLIAYGDQAFAEARKIHNALERLGLTEKAQWWALVESLVEGGEVRE
jgi:hypothetical protein